jgi:hypothetical protein
MSEVKLYTIGSIEAGTAKPFCKKWHYSKTLPGCKHYFGLYSDDTLIGVAAYGTPAMTNQQKCYHCDLELRRLCLIDDTPKNAESRFLGLTLKKLRQDGYCAVLSLADPEHQHLGTIYRASNFEYLGRERGGGSRLLIIDGHPVHSRTAFARFGTSGIKSLTKLLGNERVSGRNKQRKHVYRFVLDKKKFQALISE